MSRVCPITKSRPHRGGTISRSGKAKKEGGIGRHVTKVNKRDFVPNLRNKRLWVPELNRYVTVRVTAKALKTMDKNGVYKTLKAAGLVK